jgi:hexosaminidase
MKFLKLFSVFFVLFAVSCNKDVVVQEVNIIPAPKKTEIYDGYFTLSKSTKVIYEDNTDVKRIAEFLVSDLKDLNLPVETQAYDKDEIYRNAIIFMIDTTYHQNPEAYFLTVDSKTVIAKATEPAGLYYAYQTIKQLLPNQATDKIYLPEMVTEDEPRFKWRGMHLDVCRHFMPKEFVKKYIDYIASMKMNTFHWHLTEDQGWRIEIKAYPKLTEVGAWRKETVIGHARNKPHKFDGIKHGGFYTQEEIKEIVKYAEDRFINIVPEIEMPGHAQAAIASYPFLGCTSDDIDVWTTWGVSPYIYNLEDTTFKFLETVLSEVMELFPSKYIHIGGDEAIKNQWKASERIQKQMKELGIKDEHELQSYFITRIEKFVNSKGRTIIGWDEILEGGLAPNAVVMSWRGTEGGIAAAKQKHYVVMSPGCYFDHYQSEDKENEPLAIGGFTDVEKVYSFEPVPEELNEEEQQYILGAQANVWTEYILDPKHVEYMIFPRMIALSEVLWSTKENRNYEDFLNRLNAYRNYLDSEGINYANHVFVSDSLK